MKYAVSKKCKNEKGLSVFHFQNPTKRSNRGFPADLKLGLHYNPAKRQNNISSNTMEANPDSKLHLVSYKITEIFEFNAEKSNQHEISE